MGALKKSLFLGSVMGAGLIWLTSTKKGKEVRDQLLDQSAEIYLDLKKKIQKIDKQYNISKSAYIKMAKDTVNEYFNSHPFPGAIKDIVLKVVLSQWENLKEEAHEKVDDTKKAVKAVMKKKTRSSKKSL